MKLKKWISDETTQGRKFGFLFSGRFLGKVLNVVLTPLFFLLFFFPVFLFAKPPVPSATPELVVTIPWKIIEVQYPPKTINPDYRDVVKVGENVLPLFETSYFKSTNRYGCAQQLTLDSQGNLYFVYGQAIYVFDQKGKANEVINGFKGSVADFELYKDGRIGLLTTSYEIFKRKGFWVTLLDSNRKVISEEKKDIDWTKTDPPVLNNGVVKIFENSKKEWKEIEKEVVLSEDEKKLRLDKSRFPGLHELPDEDNIKNYEPGNRGGFDDYIGCFNGVDYFKIKTVKNGKEKLEGFYARNRSTGDYQLILFPLEEKYFNCFSCRPAISDNGNVYYLMGDEKGASVYLWPVKW